MVTDGLGGSTARSRKVSAATAVLVATALLVAFIAPLRSEFRFPIFPQDEGLLLTYPDLILKGAIPNHSFDSVYGASSLWVIAAAFKVLGTTLVVERIVGTAYRLLLVASIVLLVWRRRGPVAALFAGLTSIILLAGTIGLAAFAWVGAVAIGSLALLLLDLGFSPRRRPILLAASGVCFGLTTGFRVDLGFAVGLALLALWAVKRREARIVLAGFVAGLIPLIVSVVQAGPAAVIRDQIIQPVFVSGPYRRLPLSGLSWEQIVLLALCVIAALSLVVIGIRNFRIDRTTWDGPLLLIIGSFSVGILDQAFQRADSLHLAFVACFILPCAVLLPAPRMLRVSPRVRHAVVGTVVGIAVLALSSPYFGTIYRAASTSPKQTTVTLINDGRSVLVGSPEAEQSLSSILRVLDERATSGDRLFIGPSDLRTANYNDTFLYFMTPRLKPGSYYLEMNPGVSNSRTSSLESDLNRDQYLLLDSKWNSAAPGGTRPPLGPDGPNELVKRNFHAIASAGSWTLYQRNA